MSHEHVIAIVGLGNPGGEYAGTRHNVGFLMVEAIGESDSVKPADVPSVNWQNKKDFSAEIALVNIHGGKLILAKPQTFMNLSGKTVTALKQFYNLENKNIWVIHDDLDLPLGKAQIRLGGGLAGHHGLESIAQSLGTEEFGRIRVGIRGHELRSYHQEQGIDTNDFVLSPFTQREKDILDRIKQEVVACATELLEKKELKSHTLTVAGYETFDGADH